MRDKVTTNSLKKKKKRKKGDEIKMSKEQWAAKLNLQFWVRSRLCWQRIRGRAEVKTLQMKKKTLKMQLWKGLNWTAQKCFRIYKSALQGRNKHKQNLGQWQPSVHKCAGLDRWEGYQRLGPSQIPLAFTHSTENGEIFVSSSILLFFSFVLVFASADVELTAAARGFGATASAKGSGDFQRTMKI